MHATNALCVFGNGELAFSFLNFRSHFMGFKTTLEKMENSKISIFQTLNPFFIQQGQIDYFNFPKSKQTFLDSKHFILKSFIFTKDNSVGS